MGHWFQFKYQLKFKMNIWIQLVIELFLVLISIGWLGYLVSSIKFSILDIEISVQKLSILFWPFSGQFWNFRVAVAWAVESPQNEFVRGSYVQNINRLSWKSTISFLFCHFWGRSESWSRDHLNRLYTSSYEKVMTKILTGVLKWY